LAALEVVSDHLGDGHELTPHSVIGSRSADAGASSYTAIGLHSKYGP
jgi:hypothetical protein